MIQFYNRFILNCAKILGSLYSLASTEDRASRISWTPETDKCFARAKTAITEAIILAHPNHEADLELITDASDRAVGAVWQQISCGKCQPFAFWSKALTPAQKAWSCFERELFACYASNKHFQYFLESRDFTLKTDHKPIVKKFQHNSPAASPRQGRYIDYHYVTQFLFGSTFYVFLGVEFKNPGSFFVTSLLFEIFKLFV